MKQDRARLLAGGAVAAIFVFLSVWRSDLFWQAWAATLGQVRKGGAARAKVLAEAALFGAILFLTWRVITRRVEPARDASAALLAGLAGFVVEAWGTRAGLWTYYTGERPPLWIVPAWALGALVVDRVAEDLSGRWAGALGPAACRNLYWTLALLCLAVILTRSAGAWGMPWTWAVVAGLSAAFVVRPAFPRDFWVLISGLACVFLADFWGTTNNCWRYAVQDGAPALPGLAAGISFGMALDSALVLGCLRLVRR